MVLVEDLLEDDGEEYLMYVSERERTEVSEERGEEEEEGMELAINAMTGDFNHSTIQMKGNIKNREVSILIDIGSSSSFIDSELEIELKLRKTPTRPVVITIADGTTMVSKCVCPNLRWFMGKQVFQKNLRILNLAVVIRFWEWIGSSNSILSRLILHHLNSILRKMEKKCHCKVVERGRK